MCLVGRDPLNNVLTLSPEDILANTTEWSGNPATNKFPYFHEMYESITETARAVTEEKMGDGRADNDPWPNSEVANRRMPSWEAMAR
jgi:hypothetical protein